MKSVCVLLLFATFSAASFAGPSSTGKKLSEVRRACRRHYKTGPVCSCVTKNISSKLQQGELDQAQLDDVILVMKNLYVMGQIFQPRLESVADYLTGLEFHCGKNPKYSVN